MDSGKDSKESKPPVSEESLQQHMQRSMRLSIDGQSYKDAIFFADKIVNLVQSRESSSGAQLNQAAAPPGGTPDHHGNASH